jgi:hypothetical protein
MTKSEIPLSEAAILIKGMLGGDSLIPMHRTTLRMMLVSGARSPYETTALLEQIVYWQNKMNNEGGWFYNTREEWMKQLLFSERQLKNAIAHLKSIGLLETKRKPTAYNGSTANLLYFRIDLNLLAAFMTGSATPSVKYAEEEEDDDLATEPQVTVAANGHPDRNETDTSSASKLYGPSVSTIYRRLQQEITTGEKDPAPSAADLSAEIQGEKVGKTPPRTTRVAKGEKATPAPRKERERDAYFDAAAPFVIGSSDPISIKIAGNHIAKVAKLLREGDITVEEIPAVAKFIHSRMVTPQAFIRAGSWQAGIPEYRSERDGTAVKPAGKKAEMVAALMARRTPTESPVDPEDTTDIAVKEFVW